MIKQLDQLILLFYLSLLSIQVVNGQSNDQIRRLTGFVQDKVSGERIVGCNILSDKGELLAQSNNYGYFSFQLSESIDHIRISYVGYMDTIIDRNLLLKDSLLVIGLIYGYELETIEVKAERQKSIDHGKLSIPIKRLSEVPVIGGEPDIFKALSLLPGVSTGLEGTSGLLVRGGSPDQNLILLDGATIYNASHLFGLITIFNPLALKSVDLTKGNFPARFGGRLSSIVDVTMKEGSNREFGGEYSVGIINSSFLTEGPIQQNKSSFMVCGRATYSGLLATLFSNAINSENDIDFLVYDLNAKVNFDLGNRHKLFLSSFHGNNLFGTTLSENDGTYSFNNINRNSTLSLRHTYNSTSGYFWTNILAYNSFDSGVQLGFTSPDEQVSVNHRNINRVEDWTFRSQIDFFNISRHNIKTGVEWIFKQMNPSQVSREVNRNSQSTQSVLSGVPIASNQISFFVEDRYTLLKRLTLNIGARASLYLIDDYQVAIPEPRASIEFQPNSNSSTSLGYARMSQPIHYLLSTNNLQNEIWLPATQNLSPQLSDIFSLSYNYKWTEKKLNLQVELFYKNLYNQVDYRSDIAPFFDVNITRDWEAALTGNGIGRAYGFEVLLQYNSNRLDGWIAYTLSRNIRRFENINNGLWYRHMFDRPHEFSAVGSYTIKKGLSITSNIVVQSGNLFTIPEALQIGFDGRIQHIYNRRNNFRVPPLFRLDIGLTWSYKSKKGNLSSWNFSVYNVFAGYNINTLSYRVARDTMNTDNLTGSLSGRSFFRWIPGLNYKYSFGKLTKERFYVY